MRLREAIDLLAEFPLIGQSTDRPGLRRLVVLPCPYVVVYQLRETEVVIIGVRLRPSAESFPSAQDVWSLQAHGAASTSCAWHQIGI